MNIKQFTAESLSWVALGIFERLESDGRAASASNLVSLWAETGLRQSDLIQGVVVLVRQGYLATEDMDADGPQFGLTEQGRACIEQRRASESLDPAALFASIQRQLRERRGDSFTGTVGERREGFF